MPSFDDAPDSDTTPRLGSPRKRSTRNKLTMNNARGPSLTGGAGSRSTPNLYAVNTSHALLAVPSFANHNNAIPSSRSFGNNPAYTPGSMQLSQSTDRMSIHSTRSAISASPSSSKVAPINRLARLDVADPWGEAWSVDSPYDASLAYAAHPARMASRQSIFFDPNAVCDAASVLLRSR